MTATHLAGDPLGKINKAAVHPVLPEDADGRGAHRDAEGRRIRLDHAEGAVDGPEEEEDDEHVGDEHDVSRPSGARGQVGGQEAVEAEVVLGGHLRKVVPMRNGVNPREEDNGPGRRDVEGDVLVELDDAVERGLPRD
ncbi:hypothetical protein NPX13_g9178 [Xylaria arbuscula]|uniref:Uncharacterized protein n=1 Tax=Xylaria arbuscula TaxID=114810 RepID=A0A9W8N710_9PEZI|nr:hypothetical protein NPX13_g9178 [Xylaria arbuscula]